MFLYKYTQNLYLPKCSFSSRIKDAATATATTDKGVKTDTKRGPLMCTHHDVIVTIKPEPTIPCNNMAFCHV